MRLSPILAALIGPGHNGWGRLAGPLRRRLDGGALQPRAVAPLPSIAPIFHLLKFCLAKLLVIFLQKRKQALSFSRVSMKPSHRYCKSMKIYRIIKKN